MAKEKIDIDKMIQLYDTHGGCHARVAKDLGCSREYVRLVLGPMGLKANGRKDVYHPPKGPTRYTPEFLRELYEKANGKYKQMAKLAGVKPPAISSAILRAGLEIELKSKSKNGRQRKILTNQLDVRNSISGKP